jgi:hypothetical protein|nr:MAG TPA: hypothetical protein [Caudoviricetes sp.]
MKVTISELKNKIKDKLKDKIKTSDELEEVSYNIAKLFAEKQEVLKQIEKELRKIDKIDKNITELLGV